MNGALKAQKDRARSKFKFGIHVSDSKRHSYFLDKLKLNTKWADTIGKELKDVDV